MLCCHKYPYKYYVFLDSCEQTYFRRMIARHKDVFLEAVFASFFIFFKLMSETWLCGCTDVSEVSLKPVAFSSNTTIQREILFALVLFVYTFTLMRWYFSVILFFLTQDQESRTCSLASPCSAAPSAIWSSTTCCKFHQGKLKRLPH